MGLTESLIMGHTEQTPERYGERVRWIALIYVVLDLISVAIIVTVAWRVRYFIALAQRSNVETLTIAIIFVLALYYLATTWKGFVGGLRMAWLNAPRVFSHGQDAQERVERRKHSALKTGGKSKYVCLDQAVRLRGKPQDDIKWQIGDSAGKLGELVIEGVRITYYPTKDGMSNSLFEFVTTQVIKVLKKQDREASLQITEWSSIDEDKASQYHSMVKAFCNLEKQLGKEEELWPRVEITEEDKEEVDRALRQVVPALRNESLMPDLEYEVEYNVPIIPEPLGFLQLTRSENRADPLATMGCAGLAMLIIMAILTFIILLPPWVPSR